MRSPSTTNRPSAPKSPLSTLSSPDTPSGTDGSATSSGFSLSSNRGGSSKCSSVDGGFSNAASSSACSPLARSSSSKGGPSRYGVSCKAWSATGTFDKPEVALSTSLLCVVWYVCRSASDRLMMYWFSIRIASPSTSARKELDSCDVSNWLV